MAKEKETFDSNDGQASKDCTDAGGRFAVECTGQDCVCIHTA